MEKYAEMGYSLVLEYGPKLVGAIIVWIIGGIVIKAMTKGFERILNKRDIDLIAIGREFLENNKFLEINNF